MNIAGEDKKMFSSSVLRSVAGALEMRLTKTD